MTEYIEREAAIDAVDVGNLHRGIVDALQSIIAEIPVADVKPVLRARWVICCDGYYPYCSNCRQEPQGRIMTDFCPNCGADMREG